MLNKGALNDPFEPEALALFAAITVKPSDSRKRTINKLIRSLKSGGIWSKLDAIYVFAAADAQTALLNWKGPGGLFNCTAVNSPTFTADRGYTGNGTNMYLSSGYAPSTSGGQFAQNSANIFVWGRTVAQDAGALVGQNATAKTCIYTRFTDDFNYHKLNSAGFQGPASTDGSGLFAASRDNSATFDVYRNGVFGSTRTEASVALTADIIDFLHEGTAYATGQIAAGGFSAFLTAGEEAFLYNDALNPYLVAVGAA